MDESESMNDGSNIIYIRRAEARDEKKKKTLNPARGKQNGRKLSLPFVIKVTKSEKL